MLYTVTCGASEATTDIPKVATSKSATSDVKPSEFCALFQALSARRAAGGGENGERNKDEADWNRNIETVTKIANSAPAEIKPQAETYVQMVILRKELAAAHGYGELSAQTKLEFGRAHAAMQMQVNQLIAYAKANCHGVN
ncbi:MAG: hypothetical protein QM808_07970 [Steroidobacteraceae bacterium]